MQGPHLGTGHILRITEDNQRLLCKNTLLQTEEWLNPTSCGLSITQRSLQVVLQENRARCSSWCGRSKHSVTGFSVPCAELSLSLLRAPLPVAYGHPPFPYQLFLAVFPPPCSWHLSRLLFPLCFLPGEVLPGLIILPTLCWTHPWDFQKHLTPERSK